VETLDIAVLPGTVRLDVECFDLIFTEPSLNFAGNKFGAIISPDMLGNAVLHHRLPERSKNLIRPDLAFRPNGQTLSLADYRRSGFDQWALSASGVDAMVRPCLNLCS